MKIRVNGKEVFLKRSVSIKRLIEMIGKDCDVVVYNGFATTDLSIHVKEGDNLFFIKRGSFPAKDELEFFMLSRYPHNVYSKLKSSCVGIAGVGGLGSNVAIALARIGVGKIIIADFDIVEPSNLNRQHYFVKDIGRPKVEAMTETLKLINPYIAVEPYNIKLKPENIPNVFKDAKIIIEAFDKAEEKVMLIKTCVSLGKIVIAGSGVAGYGDNDSIITRKINDNFYVIGDNKSEAVDLGLMAPRVMIGAAKQANLAVELLIEKL